MDLASLAKTTRKAQKRVNLSGKFSVMSRSSSNMTTKLTSNSEGKRIENDSRFELRRDSKEALTDLEVGRDQSGTREEARKYHVDRNGHVA